jgi:hypothetical protein
LPCGGNLFGLGFQRKVRVVSLPTPGFHIDAANVRGHLGTMAPNLNWHGRRFPPIDRDSASVRARRQRLRGGRLRAAEESLFSHDKRKAWKIGWALWGIHPMRVVADSAPAQESA